MSHRHDEGVSFFPIPAEADLPAGLQKLFAKSREVIGFVPNVFRAYAWRADRFSAWFSHFRLLHEPSENLSAADREMIAVVVSSANRCVYCVVSHGAELREALGDVVLADQIVVNWRHADLDDRRRAICAYAEKLTLRPAEVDADDVQTLLDAGLTAEEAWDVAEITAMYNFTNRLSSATGMRPNAEYYRRGR